MGETASYGVKSLQGSRSAEKEKFPADLSDPPRPSELEAGELTQEMLK